MTTTTNYTEAMETAAYRLVETREQAYALGILLGLCSTDTTAVVQSDQWAAVTRATDGDRDRWALFVAGWNGGVKCAVHGATPMRYLDHPITRGESATSKWWQEV